MTDNDVLKELDQWLDPDENKLLPNALDDAQQPGIATLAFGFAVPMIRRARDEIVALRAMREAHIRMLSANCSEARAEALEEAAAVLDGFALGRGVAHELRQVPFAAMGSVALWLRGLKGLV